MTLTDEQIDVGIARAEAIFRDALAKEEKVSGDSARDIANRVDNEQGNTALICAAYAGHTEIISRLIDLRASLSAGNKMKCNPIWVASGYGKVEVRAEVCTACYSFNS